MEKRIAWRKSSYSTLEGNCVELATIAQSVAVRDSKEPTGPMLTFTATQWAAFTGGVRAGEFD